MANLIFVLAAASIAAPAACSSLDGSAVRLRGGMADLAAAVKPVAIISGAGVFSPSAAASVATGISGQRSVVATVGGSLRARRLLNALFDTSFDTERGVGPTGGAFVATAPELLIVHTESATTAAAEHGSVADECALGSFALTLASAVLVLPSCAEPTKEMMTET